MKIEEMHYNFINKMNELSSSRNRGFKIPEIDALLNEAQLMYVGYIIGSRNQDIVEASQRNIDSLRTIIQDEVNCAVSNKICQLPQDYYLFIRGKINMSNGLCNKTGTLFIRRHREMFEQSPFDQSSFDWAEVNGVFTDQGIKLYADFDINEVWLTYIKKPVYMHSAANYRNGQYLSPAGTLLTGTIDCQLPDMAHYEIVDLAVMLANGQINNDMQTSILKNKLNETIKN